MLNFETKPYFKLKPEPFDPTQVWLFRILPIPVLEEIVRYGRICPPSYGDLKSYEQHQLAKPNMIEKRKTTNVPLHLGSGCLHDYVAFYFAPRSPMLFSIFKRNAHGVKYEQHEIVYLVTKISSIIKVNLPFVFTDCNALLKYAKFDNRLEFLEHFLDFTVLQAEYWNNTPQDAQRIERRQAEFLVKGSIPLNAISHVAVMNEVKQKIVQSFFNNVSTYIPKVTIKRHWYY